VTSSLKKHFVVDRRLHAGCKPALSAVRHALTEHVEQRVHFVLTPHRTIVEAFCWRFVPISKPELKRQSEYLACRVTV
jgi:hypothetical protein